MNMNKIKITPRADALIESLRDIGYTLETALADIVDNSITADARQIDIHFAFEEGEKSCISILDDGTGMERQELLDAMRPGSRNPKDDRDADDLGRFGLGMKTASFSQCRRMTVASRKNGVLSLACWDLDHVSESGEWELLVPEESDIGSSVCLTFPKDHGTVVLWEKLDRIVDATDSRKTESMFYHKMDLAKKHLEMVFHRFLKGREKRIRKVGISINRLSLEPFDPFNENNPATTILPEEKIVLNGEIITIQPYILPHHSKVSKSEYEKYAGEGGYLNNQGFYVYRNGRLLISGTWFRLIPKSPLTQLARIRIDLPNNMDDLWKIDVKKSMVQPPAVIRNRLKEIIDKIAGSSVRVYTNRGCKSQSDITPIWERHARHGEIVYEINRKHPLIQAFSRKLDSRTQKEFDEILDMVQMFFPKDMFFSDYAKAPEKTGRKSESVPGEVVNLGKKYFELVLKNSGQSIEEIVIHLKMTEPFSDWPDVWANLIERWMNE